MGSQASSMDDGNAAAPSEQSRRCQSSGGTGVHTTAARRIHIDHENPNEELIKCVVVGDSGVGKTKLVCARACGTSYTLASLMQSHVPTVWAIDHYAIDKEVFDQSLSTIDGVRVSLRLWDTFGYHDKDRRFAYGRASVVLLCFSLVRPASLRNAQAHWCPEIRKCCPGVPVVLVGCQADLRYLYSYKSFIRLDKGPFFRQIADSDLIFPDAGRRAAQAMGAAAYYETSVLTGFGVKATFDNAIRAALLRKASCTLVHNLKGIKQPLPQAPHMPPKPDPPEFEYPWSEGTRVISDIAKLLADTCFPDVVFVCQQYRYYCHRIVLAAGCTWMRELFRATEELLKNSHERKDFALTLPETYATVFELMQQHRSDGDPTCSLLELHLRDSSSSVPFAALLRFLYTCKISDLADAAGFIQVPQEDYLLAEFNAALLTDDRQLDPSGRMSAAHSEAACSLDYLQRRSQQMKQLLFDGGLYSDVTLEMADGELYAHRCILSTRSEVMRAMLQGTFKEGTTQKISFKDVTRSTGSALLELLYTGSCKELKPCGFVELLALANRLCLPHVVARVERACILKLSKLEASGENILPLVLAIMEVAQLHNAGHLAEWCRYHVSVNYHYCFTHHLRELRELSPENHSEVARNRWPPLWFLKETGEYLKLVRGSRKELEPKRSYESPVLPAGCLCFSTKIRRVRQDGKDLDTST